MLCGLGALLGLALSSLELVAFGWDQCMVYRPDGCVLGVAFAVPASPLAQPWNIVIGNTIAAVIGVTCALYISNLTEAFCCCGFVDYFDDDDRFFASTEGAVAITAVLGGGRYTS